MPFWPRILSKKRKSDRHPPVTGSAPEARSGFSLVEMLVCVSIIAVIAAGLMSVFFAGVRIWKRASGGGFSRMSASLEAERICSEIRQCLPLQSVGCSGKKDEISFPFVSPGGRVVRVNYKFLREENRLKRSETDMASILAEDEETSERYVECFNGFSAEYRSFDKDNQSFVWQETWDKSLGAFGAVRLTFKAGDEEFSRIVMVPGR